MTSRWARAALLAVHLAFLAPAWGARDCEQPGHTPDVGACARLPGAELFHFDTGPAAAGPGKGEAVLVSMMIGWVEAKAVPPDAPVLSARDPRPPHAVTSTRPMCRYPLYPRYRGTGDVRMAQSFVCVPSGASDTRAVSGP